MLKTPKDAPLFQNDDTMSEYTEQGFVTQRLLDQDTIGSIRTAALSKLNSAAPGFFSSVLQSPAERHQMSDMIRTFVDPVLAGRLKNFRVVLASLVSRSPGSGQSDLPLHQDWSFVDEARACSMSVWIPLQPVTPANGCMQVVPGSHKHAQPLRHIGSGFRYGAIEEDLRKTYLQDVPLQAGEAVFFDHKLIHGSHSNHSDKPRLAIGVVILPMAEPLHMGIVADGVAQFSDRPDDFLLTADLAKTARTSRLTALA